MSEAIIEADTTSSRGSSNSGSNGDYEFISKEETDINFGEAIQIVKVSEERKFELDIEALSSILLKDYVRDLPIAVVSIAGDFRKGKSFLLNFFLRYLHSSSNSIDWVGDSSSPLKGFSWRGGSERETTGILMWSKPFVVTQDNGKKVAIVLMDTQGAFDSEYTVRDSATVFALSTMTSSLQVFNLMHNLQEDNLQVLEIFTEYGRLALEETDEKPFQKLVFLIRDWSYPYEHPYGLQGGQKLLEKKLAIKENQPAQLQRVRRHIRSCFKDIDCFLLPHPGNKVSTKPTFDGRISDIDEEFLRELQIMVPLLLDPKNIVVKHIGGQEVTGRQLVEYFKVYINIFAGETMPEPKSMLEATAEANNLSAVATAKDMYLNKMEDVCGGDRPFMNPKKLVETHEEFINLAMDSFDSIPKMGGKEFSESYRERLMMEMNASFEHFESQNKSKNVFNLLGTPAVLLVACVICFISASVFELVNLMPLANLFRLIATVDIGLIAVYMFCRFSGHYPDLIVTIDLFTERLWLFCLEMGFKAMQNAMERHQQQQTQSGPSGSTAGSRSPLTPGPSAFSSAHPLMRSTSSSTQKKYQ